MIVVLSKGRGRNRLVGELHLKLKPLIGIRNMSILFHTMKKISYYRLNEFAIFGKFECKVLYHNNKSSMIERIISILSNELIKKYDVTILINSVSDCAHFVEQKI